MKNFLFLICLVLSVNQLKAQVNKDIVIKSRPEGALLTSASGKIDIIGKTPVSNSFSFHSEISVLKLKLSACGYYDSIFKITPADDTIKINLEKKNLVILPETDNDTITAGELQGLSAFINELLNNIAARNVGKPINYADFAVFMNDANKKSIALTFEADPSAVSLPRTMTTDSLIIRVWDDLFAPSIFALNRKGKTFPGEIEIYFSVISGKNNMTIRHIPGVDVTNELRSQTTVSEDDYKRVTITTFYYETVTNPTFNSSVAQTQKYNEILFHVVFDKQKKNFSLSGTAALNMTNGRMSILYESQNGLSSSSMLTRFMNNVKR